MNTKAVAWARNQQAGSAITTLVLLQLALRVDGDFACLLSVICSTTLLPNIFRRPKRAGTLSIWYSLWIWEWLQPDCVGRPAQIDTPGSRSGTG